MPALLQRALGALILAASLAGCSGGVYLGYEYSDYDDQPPSVSLASSSTAARAGEVVRLVAAASDDYYVDRVEFYHVDDQGLGSRITILSSPPYTVDVIVPVSSTGVVYFMARAVDDVGQMRDSSIIAVTVLP